MQITYFPYLAMKDSPEVNFKDLNVKVWNYSKKADEYIKDADMRTTIDALMATNISHRQTIDDMGIITIGNCDFHNFSEQEKILCEEVQLLLFIGAISRSGVLDRGANTGHYMFTTENFTVLEQNFEINGERMAIQSGYIVRKWAGGYKIAEVKFSRPDYTPTPMMFKGDERMIQGLLKLRKKQKRTYRRLMRAIDMFMQAYNNDTKTSMQSRVLLIASAYEILFDLPDKEQRKELRAVFNDNFVQPNDVKRRYTSVRQPTKNNPKKYRWETGSIKIMWIDKFYTLRNKIIHGSIVKPNDYDFCGKQRHFDIATLFFILGLRKMMEVTPSIKSTTDYIVWKKYEDLDGEEKYEGFSYEEMDSWTEIIRDMRRRGKGIEPR